MQVSYINLEKRTARNEQFLAVKVDNPVGIKRDVEIGFPLEFPDQVIGTQGEFKS